MSFGGTRAIAALLALPALVPLGLVAFNAVCWTRGRALPEAAAAAPDGISVLIPARDEVANIERCVRSVDAAGFARHEARVEELSLWAATRPREGDAR